MASCARSCASAPRRRLRVAGALVAVLLGTSCRHLPGRAPAAPPHAKSPLSQRELRTTNPDIAIGNLSGPIDRLERALAAGRLNSRRLGELVELFLERGQALTRIADYERAAAVADRFVRERPLDPDAYLARARSRATLHRFADALADLDEAARRHGHGSRIEAARAAVLQAVGRYDEALAIRRRAAAAYPNILTLGAEASVLADRGDVEAAERLFVAAQDAYRDVSPFPLCWLYFQQGMMWMRAGNLTRARELFAAAHERLPQNAAVADHLGVLAAALGDRDGALRLLRDAAAVSDDPAASADLARVLQYAGRPDEAAHWRRRAAERYEELLRRYPAAFANHAAVFWLGAGGDAHQALALARRLVQVQKTPAAYALLLQAALAAGEPEAACRAAAQALRFGGPTPYDGPLGERATAARVARGCGTAAS